MLARKNGKTPFTTAKIWMLGVAYSRSYSKIKTVAGSAKQNMEGFGFLGYNLHRLGLTVREDAVHGLRVLDSSLGHSYYLFKLSEQGELYRRWQGHTRGPVLTEQFFRVNLAPREVAAAKDAIRTAIVLGFQREEKETSDLDLGLVELQKKTESP